MIIFTHRGLEKDNSKFFPESSFEAFSDQIKRGFGIEFDTVICKDGIVISHDNNLKRLTSGKDLRNFSDMSLEDVKKIKYGSELLGTIGELGQILRLIEGNKCEMSTLHLRGAFQEGKVIDLLLDEMAKNPEVIEKLLIFNVKPEAARYIKQKLHGVKLAPSVAHPHDIERYNSVSGGTLITIDDSIKYKKEGIYDWVWLDEWDLVDRNGKKKLYTKENFERLREAGYKIALVTPELHGTSPGLIGGEAHEEGLDEKKLFRRISEIIDLRPDAICTDRPERVKKMIH